MASFSTGCGSSCDSSRQELVASLFAAAYTNPQGYVNFVQQNSNLFKEDKYWHKCFDELSSELMKSALTGPSSDSIRESAYSIAGGAGAPHLGESLYDDMMQSRLDMYSLANHLNMLASITYQIANGNENAYYNSQFYVVAKMFGNIDATYAKMTSNLLYWYVYQFARQM